MKQSITSTLVVAECGDFDEFSKVYHELAQRENQNRTREQKTAKLLQCLHNEQITCLQLCDKLDHLEDDLFENIFYNKLKFFTEGDEDDEAALDGKTAV
jgi:hypothetical protein